MTRKNGRLKDEGMEGGWGGGGVGWGLAICT